MEKVEALEKTILKRKQDELVSYSRKHSLFPLISTFFSSTVGTQYETESWVPAAA